MPKVQAISDLGKCITAVAESREQAAFVVLFEYYTPRLKTYFRRLGIPSAAADDLTQETMLRLWTKASCFDEAKKGSPSAWLFTIARNLYFDWLPDRRLAPLEVDWSAMVDPEPMADEMLEKSEAAALLHHTLRNLPKVQADLLSASFFEEKSHEYISHERNLPLGTVKSTLRRALTRLRAVLP